HRAVEALQDMRLEGLKRIKAARGFLKGAGALDVPPAMARAVTKLVGELEYAVQTAELAQEEKVVQIQVRVRFDIPEWLASLQGATADARSAAERTVTMNNLRQIGLALKSYHNEHGRLPPATVYSADGRPLYSWRVALLPYLEQKELYDAFKHD